MNSKVFAIPFLLAAGCQLAVHQPTLGGARAPAQAEATAPSTSTAPSSSPSSSEAASPASSDAASPSPSPAPAEAAPSDPASTESVDMYGRPQPVPTSAAATCDAAHNHCLHENTWFVTDIDPALHTHDTTECYRYQGKLYSYSGDMGVTELHHGYVALHTVPATLATLKTGDLAVVFVGDRVKLGTLPTSTQDTYESEEWRMVTVGDINASDGTFQVAGDKTWVPLGVARVTVERLDGP